MKQYNNILVNALVNLGDVVLTTSAIALLKKAYPNAKVTMLCKGVVRQAVENNPVIDEVMVFDYKAKQNSLGKMLDMVKEIKRHNFDLCILVQFHIWGGLFFLLRLFLEGLILL